MNYFVKNCKKKMKNVKQIVITEKLQLLFNQQQIRVWKFSSGILSIEVNVANIFRKDKLT